MLVNPPASVKRFIRRIDEKATKPQVAALIMFVTGIVLAQGKRTMAAIGRATARARRYRGTISRMTRSHVFRTREIYADAVEFILGLVLKAERVVRGLLNADRPTWVLAIDDVATVRGGLTKIANGLHKRTAKKNPGKKTRAPTKSFTFVMGLLISPRGARVPMPRKTWRTKEYAKQLRKKYVSKITLAVQMVRDAVRRLPAGVDLVVLADALYDTEEFVRACRRLKVTVITSLDSARVFADVRGGRSKGAEERTLHGHGRNLPKDAFERIVFEAGAEGTASYRRRTAKVSKRKGRRGRRVYRVAHERRDVAGLGEVGVVYSWKSPVYRPRIEWDRESFKVLVCSDPTVPAALVVELYELRWEVEILFRELKSGLGLGQYLGTSFEAFERLVDMTLLSYLYLEWLRMAEPDAELESARLTALKCHVDREAAQGDLRYIERRLDSERGRRTLRNVVRQLAEAG